VLTPVDESIFIDKDNDVLLKFKINENSEPILTCYFLNGNTKQFHQESFKGITETKSVEEMNFSTTTSLARKLNIDLSKPISYEEITSSNNNSQAFTQKSERVAAQVDLSKNEDSADENNVAWRKEY